MNINNKLRNFLISFLPLLLLGIFVLYYLNKNKEIKTNNKVKIELPQKNNKNNIYQNEYEYSNGLEIKGDKFFEERIKQALKLIWLSNKEDFLFIKQYVFEIRQDNKTNFYFDNEKPVISMSDNHAFKSITWASGVIAHNAFHAYEETNKKLNKNKKIKVPLPGEDKRNKTFINPLNREYKSFDDFLESEKKATKYQLKILKEIGAPKKEILKLLKREEKDFSLAHDGQYLVNP